MKAQIDKTGTLFIVPESGTEAYAINKWMEEFNTKDKNGGCEVVLAIKPLDAVNNKDLDNG